MCLVWALIKKSAVQADQSDYCWAEQPFATLKPSELVSAARIALPPDSKLRPYRSQRHDQTEVGRIQVDVPHDGGVHNRGNRVLEGVR